MSVKDFSQKIRKSLHRKEVALASRPPPASVPPVGHATMGPMPDVVVIGAGPAGVSAAVTLRRLGRDVTMVDKAVFPRDKCCGDGLTAAALRRVEHLGLDPARVASWQPVDDVVVVSASGRAVEMPLGRTGSSRSDGGGWSQAGAGGGRSQSDGTDSSQSDGAGWPRSGRAGRSQSGAAAGRFRSGRAGGGLFAVSARRADLDAALVDLARRAGVDVVEGEAVEDVDATGDGLAVTTDAGRRLDAAYAVAADGMWSPTRRRLGLTPPGYLGEWQAGRQYLAGTGPLARKLWVWFEPDMIPGYAWSFPLPGGQVNFGYGVLRGRHESLRGQAIDWRDRPHIAAVLGPATEPVGPWRAWPIPARIGDAAAHGLGGRVLFAGDAAGACDPMTGEGIAQALETGEAAAQAVVQAGPDRPGQAAARYDRTLAWGMVLDDRLAGFLSTVLARPGGSDRALALVDASDWCRRHFARWMFEDYPRAALATPHRWRRRMFTRPGAYASVGPAPRPNATFATHD